MTALMLPTLGADTLLPSDLTRFATFGLTVDLLDRFGVFRVTHDQARDRLGVTYKSDHLEGIVYSHVHPVTGQVVTSRLRRDHPELDSDGKPIAKYLSPPNDHRHLYFPAGVVALLADTTCPVVFVEAPSSALTICAAAQRRGRLILSIATNGDYGWRGVTGKVTDASGARVDEKGPLPDLDLVTWTGRDTILAFDSNATIKDEVRRALRAFTAEGVRRGASVRIAVVPAEDGINGPDDLRAKRGDDALFAVLDAAKPANVKGGKPEPKKQGREVQLDDPEPWADPVDGELLLDSIVDVITQYVALPPHTATTVALWLLHTYLIDVVFTTPILAVSSPVKRCGKTLLLIVAGSLVPRRLFTANVTPAVLFRAIEKYRPTLLIDEADSFIRDNEELRGVLNSGHTRTTAAVIRAVGDDHEPRLFSTWCAKAIALIGALPGTLADRSIEVKMRRRAAGESIARLRQDRIEAECADLRRRAARWTADHADVVRAADPDVPDLLHDRAADCWRPLLAIADAAGGTWPERARKAAVGLAGGQDEADVGVELLADIATILEDTDDDPIKTSVLLERLVAIEDRPWADWRHGKALTAHGLARLLARFDVLPAGKVRVGDTTIRGYRRDAFADAFARYLPLKAEQWNKPNDDGQMFHFAKRNKEPKCSTSQSGTNPIDTEKCSTVPLRIPGEGVNPQREEGHDDADEVFG